MAPHLSATEEAEGLSVTSKITLHVGLPKTGSSSIQAWLQNNRRTLSRHGVRLLAATADRGRVEVRPYAGGAVNSGGVISLLQDPMVKRQSAREFVVQLRDHADRFGHVVLSGEALSQPFWQQDCDVLDELNCLGENHRCEVIYYMSPQHKMLEAAWRQWGFRTGHSPSDYVRALSKDFHYWSSLSMRRAAPNLTFLFRPFVRSQLFAGNVVVDFAATALGIAASEVNVSEDANVGVPLVVVNLLATVPQRLLWESAHDNARFDRIKQVLQGVAQESTRTQAGRAILERWAFDRYGDENLKLIGELGWPADGWPRDDGGCQRDVGLLDDLWRPSASAEELAVIHRLLDVVSIDR